MVSVTNDVIQHAQPRIVVMSDLITKCQIWSVFTFNINCKICQSYTNLSVRLGLGTME